MEATGIKLNDINMIITKLKTSLSSYSHAGSPGLLDTPGIGGGNNSATVSAIDNRRLIEEDGFIVMTLFGRIFNPDPASADNDDLQIAFGVDGDNENELSLFSRKFIGATNFKIELFLHRSNSAYIVNKTVLFDDGLNSPATSFDIVDMVGANNITTIRFKTSSVSGPNSYVQILSLLIECKY